MLLSDRPSVCRLTEALYTLVFWNRFFPFKLTMKSHVNPCLVPRLSVFKQKRARDISAIICTK